MARIAKSFLFLLMLGVSGVIISACTAQAETFRERLEARRTTNTDSTTSGTFRSKLMERFTEKSSEGGLAGGMLANRNSNAESVVIDKAEKIVFQLDGAERVFYVYRPETRSATEVLPVLLILHGGKGNGPSMAEMVDLYEEANQHGFIAVYPQSNEAEWNDGRTATDTGISDVNYLKEVARQLVADWGAAKNRIYVAGISSGGNMSQKLACLAPDSFAGFGVVASNMMENLNKDCLNVSSLKPMAFFYGTADPLNTFDGKEGSSPLAAKAKGAGEEVRLSSPETLAYWAKKKGCISAQARMLPDVSNDGTRVAQVNFIGCRTPEIAFIVIDGGHNWPGETLGAVAEKLVGKSTQDISATEELIKFFKLDR